MSLYLENLFYLKNLFSRESLSSLKKFSLDFIFSFFFSSLFSPYSPHRGDMGGLSLFKA